MMMVVAAVVVMVLCLMNAGRCLDCGGVLLVRIGSSMSLIGCALLVGSHCNCGWCALLFVFSGESAGNGVCRQGRYLGREGACVDD